MNAYTTRPFIRRCPRRLRSSTTLSLHRPLPGRNHHAVKTLCQLFFFWRHQEFQQFVHYPVPTDPPAPRLEMVRLSKQGWTEVRIAELLRVNRKTVRKWLRNEERLTIWR
jgi:Homeodomain-like domain